MKNNESHAGEEAGPSTLAVDRSATPSASRRGEPAPASSDAVLRGIVAAFVEWGTKCRDGDDGCDYMNGDGDKYPGNGFDDLDALLDKASAALSSAPLPAAGPQVPRSTFPLDHSTAADNKGAVLYFGSQAERDDFLEWLVEQAALTSPAAGSDGWQRDAALEEAAQVCVKEASRYDATNIQENALAGECLACALLIRALKSAAPTQTDGWQRDAALEEAAKIAEGEYGQNAWKQNMAISDYIAKAIRALKSAAPTLDGWQPIETAPKDGYVIVAVPVYWSKDGSFSHWDTWSTDMADDHDEENVYSGWRIKDATLWRPLPAAPTPSTASDGQ